MGQHEAGNQRTDNLMAKSKRTNIQNRKQYTEN